MTLPPWGELCRLSAHELEAVRFLRVEREGRGFVQFVSAVGLTPCVMLGVPLEDAIKIEADCAW